MSSHIYHGPWINWSKGLISGATVTLGEREGGFLTAFIATFVTVVGAELWKIFCFVAHQTRSKHTPQDGLYHQQQVILRTSPTPAGAAWLFLRQTWSWSGKAKSAVIRSLPWAVFGVLYVGAVGVMAILSSQISKSPGPQRLLRGECGLWGMDETSPANSSAYQSKIANDTLTAASYSKACYGGNDDPLRCGRYPVPNLQWNIDRNATCPFADDLCVFNGSAAAITMTSKPLDSSLHLGINAPASDRLLLQKTATCAPIHSKGYAQVINVTESGGLGRAGDVSVQWYYGPMYDSPTDIFQNYTYAYNTHAELDGFSWSTASIYSNSGNDMTNGGWVPVDALANENADVTVIFIAGNSMYFTEPCDDPIFAAHLKFGSDATGYAYNTDLAAGVLGCIEQYRLCNPNNNVCMPWRGYWQVGMEVNANDNGLNLNLRQNATAYRLMTQLQFTGIYQQILTRPGGSLRASETALGTTQAPLPNNQWQIELSAWFDTGLARLQAGVQQLAANTANMVPGSKFLAYDPFNHNNPYAQFCRNQIVNDSSDSTSFSVLGLVILFVVGFAIIFISLTIDTIAGYIQQKTGKGTHARMEWLVNDRLQMHALLLRQLGLGTWADDVSKRIPVTIGGVQKFWGPGEVELSESGSGNGHHDGETGAQLVQPDSENKDWDDSAAHPTAYRVVPKNAD